MTVETEAKRVRGVGAGLLAVLILTVLAGRPAPAPAGDLRLGWDSGRDAAGALSDIRDLHQPGGGRWIRLRGVDLAKAAETRAALRQLHALGYRTCVFLRLPVAEWRFVYLPTDLRQPFEHGRKLGRTFGDLVDAWEVDNEPDLGFVPENAENYAAFLKACYWGLKQGIAGQEADGNGVASARGLSPRAAPLVLMAPLGIPPGPWVERFAANDGFAYTDGFNYHYYGYADDFTDVARLQEQALQELGASSSAYFKTPRPTTTKHLPVLLTELGYGMLGKADRNTKAGRLRQWRWFEAVGRQLERLRLEGPMAFYLPPYLELDAMEFGLTQPPAPATGPAGPGLRAGGIAYAPADFGRHQAKPWMDLIGRKVGADEATPALAWWLKAPVHDRGGPPVSRPWTAEVPAPSPVVIDFVAGEGLVPVKRYNGSFVTGIVPALPPGPPGPAPQVIPEGEEFMVHVRTANGNLYSVSPMRTARPQWNRYLEPGANFSMSFYGRAHAPWRFLDNRPVSLVFALYPEKLPAVYEFERIKLVKVRAIPTAAQPVGAGGAGRGAGPLPAPTWRYGRGQLALYNFSGQPVAGKLVLPPQLGWITDEHTVEKLRAANGTAALAEVAARAWGGFVGQSMAVTLAPGERRLVDVMVRVAWDTFKRLPAPVEFVPDRPTVPRARFLTAFLPDIGGMMNVQTIDLLHPVDTALAREFAGSALPASPRVPATAPSNRVLVATRPRVAEEAPVHESGGLFAQAGAEVTPTPAGFQVTVKSAATDKVRRVEVEVPWPDGLDFPADGFLSVDFHVRPGAP